jgi:hypothetical protein
MAAPHGRWKCDLATLEWEQVATTNSGLLARGGLRGLPLARSRRPPISPKSLGGLPPPTADRRRDFPLEPGGSGAGPGPYFPGSHFGKCIPLRLAGIAARNLAAPSDLSSECAALGSQHRDWPCSSFAQGIAAITSGRHSPCPHASAWKRSPRRLSDPHRSRSHLYGR